MLAKLSRSLPADDERWVYEMKWAGSRGLAFIEQGKPRLLTRNQIEVTRRYPELARVCARQPQRDPRRRDRRVR